MKNELFVPGSLFTFCDAAGIRNIDIAHRLSISKTLVGLWRKAKRPITWSHYQALLDYVLSPETIWHLVERLTGHELTFTMGQFMDTEKAMNYMMYKVIAIGADHQRKTTDLYENIQRLTQQLAVCTAGTPDQWDMPKLQDLSQHLADDLKHAPFMAMNLDSRVEKAFRMLQDALSHYRQRKDKSSGATDIRRRSPGQSDDQ